MVDFFSSVKYVGGARQTRCDDLQWIHVDGGPLKAKGDTRIV